MHNWEHYSRLPAYLLAATLVASCGGGGDSGLSVNGQSSAKIETTTTTVLTGLDTTSSFKIRLLDGTTPIANRDVIAQVISGSATLVSTSVKTGTDGYAEFNLKGAGVANQGRLRISYIDANGNTTIQELDYSVVDGANTVSTFSIEQVSTETLSIPTTGITQKEIVVLLKNINNSPVTGATVKFSLPAAPVNRGRLVGSTSVVTDSSGYARVKIDGLNQTTGDNNLIVSYTDAIKSTVTTAIPFKIINKYDVVLNTSSDTLKTGGGSTVLTAKVTNASQALVKGATVSFKVLNHEPIGGLDGCPQDITDTTQFKAAALDKRKVGDLTVTDALTNDSGLASTSFSVTDNNNGKRRVLVTVVDASSEQTVDCLDLALTGTTLTIDPLVINTTADQTQKITATIKNGLGAGVSGANVLFSGGGFLRTVTTGNDGTAVFSDKFPSSVSPFTATSSVFSLSASTQVIVSDVGFKVNFTDAQGTPIVGVDTNPPKGKINQDFKVTPTATGTKLRLLSTLGTVTPSTSQTDGTFTIKSTTPGLARLDFIETDATGKQSVKGSSEFRFISTDPAKMTLQSNVSTLRPNEQAVIEAKLLDAKDNPVQDVLVEFSRVDPSNGKLSTAAALTDENGKASVTFTAGALTTAKDAVQINAAVKTDSSSIQPNQPVKLTVGGEALFITIATGKTISPLNETTYAMPLSIAVADAVGQPARNSQVSLQIIPTRYLKGIYYYNQTAVAWVTAAANPTAVADGASGGGDISETLSPVACPSEDINTNGILDSGEDKNGDLILTPANPVTVSGRLLTNDDGRVSFNIQYGKSYANWLEVKLIASTSVAGSEFKAERVFVLPVLAADVTDKASTPPGGTLSPYGNLPVIYVQDPVGTTGTFTTSAVVTDTDGSVWPVSTLSNTTPV